MIDLRKGDCLEVMKSIPSGSIDAIITDPPYGTTACKWDSVIDFDLMWEQLNRIVKPNGAIVLFGSEPFSSALRMSNIKNYKYDWIWKKNGNSGDFAMAKNKPLSNIENICCFSFGKCGNGAKLRMEYNPQDLIYKPRTVKKTDGGSSSEHRPNRKVRVVKFTSEYTNYPKRILEFKKDKNKKHPTQKPVELMEYLIKTYTNENETVLDFTMGSGTTGVAAKNLNRNFIGVEQDENYFEIAKERINE
tara:strand:+ start:49 stop:789 length:741 start_codon:yes stop_codon:yes gene_type:complete